MQPRQTVGIKSSCGERGCGPEAGRKNLFVLNKIKKEHQERVTVTIKAAFSL